MVVHERARELDDESQSECDGGESCFIRSVKLWERSAYLTRFGQNWGGSTQTIEATDEWIKGFLDSSADRNNDNWDMHGFLRAIFISNERRGIYGRSLIVVAEGGRVKVSFTTRPTCATLLNC
jgi:hypothetical protein